MINSNSIDTNALDDEIILDEYKNGNYTEQLTRLYEYERLAHIIAKVIVVGLSLLLMYFAWRLVFGVMIIAMIANFAFV